MNPVLKTIPVVVVALVLGSWAIWWGACSVFDGYSSSSWPKTTGAIQESSVGRAPVIIYTYTVGGQTYHGSKIEGRIFWNSETSREVVAAYPPGSHRTVYYSPSRPDQSILITGVHRGSFFGLVLGTIILSFGALFGAMAYLGPKYGVTHGGRTYSFGDDSPAAPVVVFGMIAIFCQFGLLFWIVR